MSVELTNCCGAFPTWGDDGMFCKKCFRSVGPADLHEQATIDVPPNAEDALSFDEAEAAGLDGTLRTVGVSRRTCFEELNLIRTETLQYRPLDVTDDGNITLPMNYKTDELDITESYITCDDHGRLGREDYEAHGIAEDWEER